MTSSRGPASDLDLFADLYPRLRRVAAVAAPLDLDPDDLLQEALSRVLARGPLSDLDAPEAYLRRVIVNAAANHNRSRGRERRALARVADRAVPAEAPAYPSDLAILDDLDPADRVAVFLADVERIPVAQVAEALGVAPVAARARLSRARRRLRAALAADSHPTETGGLR